MGLTRRDLLLAAAGWPLLAAGHGVAAPAHLRDIAAERGLVYGCNINIYNDTLSRDKDYAALIARECGLFVCSRAHWRSIAPTPGEMRFTPIDGDDAWAQAHGMGFRGHCLIWHESAPAWFESLADRAAAARAIQQHIVATCHHFAGRMHSWDVVNEAIHPGSRREDGLRRTIFLDKIGPEYLDIAFRAAREGDPKTRLVYNEFDVELDIEYHREKRQSLIALIDGFKKRGTPIDAIGLQSHLSVERMRNFNARVFADYLNDLASGGLDVMLTELDVVDRGAPADIARRDAEVAAVYRRYLDVALANRAVKAVITWGLTDRYGWIVSGDYPEAKRRDGLPPRPLPFDADCRPKPAYIALAEALHAAPRR